jgi:hypothetical protein
MWLHARCEPGWQLIVEPKRSPRTQHWPSRHRVLRKKAHIRCVPTPQPSPAPGTIRLALLLLSASASSAHALVRASRGRSARRIARGCPTLAPNGRLRRW